MRLKTIFVATAVVSSVSCASEADPWPTVQDDLEALAKLREEHVRGVNATDADLVLSGVVDEIVYLAPQMDPVVGLANLRTLLRQAYQQVRPTIAMVPKEVKVVGDVAYEWGTINGSVVAGEGAAPQPINSKYVYIYRRRPDGTWRIAYDIYNDNAVSPPPQ